MNLIHLLWHIIVKLVIMYKLLLCLLYSYNNLINLNLELGLLAKDVKRRSITSVVKVCLQHYREHLATISFL